MFIVGIDTIFGEGHICKVGGGVVVLVIGW